jgi:glycine cleavage system aminomethyltransferase T
VLDGSQDPGIIIWGGELVLRDGVAVGQVTSGAWGESLGACVGLAYVRHPDGAVLTPDLARSGAYQVNVGGRLHPASVHLRPPSTPRRPRQGPLPDFFMPDGP